MSRIFVLGWWARLAKHGKHWERACKACVAAVWCLVWGCVCKGFIFGWLGMGWPCFLAFRLFRLGLRRRRLYAKIHML